jgi:hypothetical protein
MEAAAAELANLNAAADTLTNQPTTQSLLWTSPAGPVPSQLPDAQALASVWTPFHSQMSAEGFASRLSQQLNHSFQVERRGAGAYQVVFAANSTTERDRLLDQIAEITGQ